ncbi:DUF4302 domain-containing protein [Ancylomarina salipaludis]|uniref:DUF4302 domain-containing protein n=1 Tax=Ancylomarina salipaludis TaxID=2501299 RepID=A0A4V1MZR3_9BACT|nr:DUF4302 domain-containing protein [Ancylomarina salipaludis]RXQ87855.1 DUF4302 domain-containing protein [Ancylomarina salipaludis]
MKKINLYITSLLLLALGACNNDFESEFDLSPDERANEAVQEFKKALTSSEYGWLTHYYPNPDKLGSVTYMLKFEETGTVSMNWDLYDYPDEAEYSVKMIDQPLLVFDTYSKFSKMTDPEIGEPGKGYGGELEFGFVRKSVDGDTLYLAERVDEDPMVLVKATAETASLLREYAKHSEHLERLNEKVVVPFYFNLSVEGWDAKVNMVYSGDKMIAFLSYVDVGVTMHELMPVNFTHEGFEFHHPLVLNGIAVRSFKYDASKNQFDVTDAGVSGAFKYEDVCPAHLEGMTDKLYGPKTFDAQAEVFSPKLFNLFEGLYPEAGFNYVTTDPYVVSWKPCTFQLVFKDYNALKITVDYVKLTEDVVKIDFTGYETEYSGPFVDLSYIESLMATEKGMAIKALITSDKGWTIVPIELKKYSSSYCLVSNEDPEMYMTFGLTYDED